MSSSHSHASARRPFWHLWKPGHIFPDARAAWTHAQKSSNPLQSCPTPVPVRVWLSGGRDELLLRDFRFCCGPYATSSSQRLLSRVPAQVLDTKRKPHADLTAVTPCSKTTTRISMTAHFWGRTSFCSDLPLRPQHLTIPPNAPINSSQPTDEGIVEMKEGFAM